MIEQLGTGEQLVAGVVVADEVPSVYGELLAQVQLDVIDRHPPADPGDWRFAAALAHGVKTVGHSPLAVLEPAAQLRIVDPPEADLALGERSEHRHRRAL